MAKVTQYKVHTTILGDAGLSLIARHQGPLPLSRNGRNLFAGTFAEGMSSLQLEPSRAARICFCV